MTSLNSTFYVDKEKQDLMKEFYQMKRNFIISLSFLIQDNCILSRQVVSKKAIDISRKGSHPHPTPTSQRNHKKNKS